MLSHSVVVWMAHCIITDGDPNLLGVNRTVGGRRLNAFYDKLGNGGIAGTGLHSSSRSLLHF